jgi:hypothetical protein
MLGDANPCLSFLLLLLSALQSAILIGLGIRAIEPPALTTAPPAHVLEAAAGPGPGPEEPPIQPLSVPSCHEHLSQIVALSEKNQRAEIFAWCWFVIACLAVAVSCLAFWARRVVAHRPVASQPGRSDSIQAPDLTSVVLTPSAKKLLKNRSA